MGYHRRFNTNRRWWGITAGSRPSGRSGRWNRQWCFLSPSVRGTNRWWWPASASPPACNTNRRWYETSPTVRITNRRWSVFLSPQIFFVRPYPISPPMPLRTFFSSHPHLQPPAPLLLPVPVGARSSGGAGSGSGGMGSAARAAVEARVAAAAACAAAVAAAWAQQCE